MRVNDRKAIGIMRRLLAESRTDLLSIEQAQSYVDKAGRLALYEKRAWYVCIGINWNQIDERSRGMTHDIAKAIGIPDGDYRKAGYYVALGKDYNYTRWVFKEWNYSEFKDAWEFIQTLIVSKQVLP